MRCKSLWIKASAKCINLNVLYVFDSLKNSSRLFANRTTVVVLYVFDSLKNSSRLFANRTTVVVPYVFDSLKNSSRLFANRTTVVVLYVFDSVCIWYTVCVVCLIHWKELSQSHSFWSWTTLGSYCKVVPFLFLMYLVCKNFFRCISVGGVFYIM